MTFKTRISIATMILALASLGCQPAGPSDCPDRGAEDPDGHLQRICRYIRENKRDVAPANPATYTIKRIESRTDNGREVFWVFLNCCYLGDIAVVDKASGEVLSFRAGAK